MRVDGNYGRHIHHCTHADRAYGEGVATALGMEVTEPALRS